MSKLKYYLHVFSGVRFKKIFSVIDRTQEKCGKNKLAILLDMIICSVRYGAGYYDYLIFAFYDKNAKQRATMVTRFSNKKMITRLNDQSKVSVIDNKGEFRKAFTKYLGRQVLDVKGLSFDDFSAFIDGKSEIIAKPYIGESGKGIEKLKTADFADTKAMYDYVTDGRFGLIEEIIVQHSDLSRMYPNSVNTYRILTLAADDGKVYCVYATAKFGAGGKFVDNMENGGICCPIDLETGKICGCAHTSRLENFDVHPDTNITLVGYQLPRVQEAIDICKQAASDIKDSIRYIGWDAFVTEDGVGIIEGNDYPGYDFSQLPEWSPDKTGLLPYFKKMVPSAFR